MPVYWEQNMGGLQAENYNTEEEDEECETQKPQMQNIEDEKHMKDLTVNTILIFDLQMINKSMNNNYKSEKIGIQRFEDDMLKVLVESTKVFAKSSGVFTQSSDLLVQSIDVLS